MEMTIDQVLQQGVAAHKEGQLQDAERFYRAILQVQPNHPDANHNLGVLAVSIGRPLEAIPLFELALKSNPTIEQFWLSYLDVLIKLERVADFERVLANAKEASVAPEKLTFLSDQLKQALASETPSHEEINRCLTLYHANQFGETEKIAAELATRFPVHQFSWKVLGAIVRQTGKLNEPLLPMRKAVNSSQSAEAHNSLGVMLQATKPSIIIRKSHI